jgi:restriction endonuclease S subunit
MRWAYYELLTHDINSMDSGSAIPSTSREALYNLPVRLPPISEQHAIAHILGTLDDKIELNRRMNKTLEAMVRAIFKSWFVDFDPVRAKAEGRKPEGMDSDNAALFPDSFEDSELGKIPSGGISGILCLIKPVKKNTLSLIILYSYAWKACMIEKVDKQSPYRSFPCKKKISNDW